MSKHALVIDLNSEIRKSVEKCSKDENGQVERLNNSSLTIN